MSVNESAPSPARCQQCGAPLGEKPGDYCPRCLMAQVMQPTPTRGAGGSLPPLTPEELAPHFPQLEIIECLGRGGMGVVYKARQKALNRLVALKLLAPERADDPNFAARFEQEAQALAALNHPNIVGVYDFGQAGGFFYLLMEFVDGPNLRQVLQARKLSAKEALGLVPALCDALQFAHERGIVHRDIKPENLLLAQDGRVKLADFGIARLVGSKAVEEGPVGTPAYMAPEQKRMPPESDHRADIYSLGVVLYEMLTGQLPEGTRVPPSQRVAVDIRVDQVVLRALEKSPELRYQTAGDFRAQVETLTGAPGQASPTNPAAASPVQPEKRGGTLLPAPTSSPGSALPFVAILFAVVCSVLGIFAWSAEAGLTPLLLWSMFGAAGLSLLLALLARHSLAGKISLVIGALNLAFWLIAVSGSQILHDYRVHHDSALSATPSPHSPADSRQPDAAPTRADRPRFDVALLLMDDLEEHFSRDSTIPDQGEDLQYDGVVVDVSPDFHTAEIEVIEPRPGPNAVHRELWTGKHSVKFAATREDRGPWAVNGVGTPFNQLQFKAYAEPGGTRHPRPRLPQNPEPGTTFGPVIWRRLVFNKTLTNSFLNIGTGQTLSAPGAELQKWQDLENLRVDGVFQDDGLPGPFVCEWMKTTGADFVLCPNNALVQVDGIWGGMFTNSLNFDSASPHDVRRQLEESEAKDPSSPEMRGSWTYSRGGTYSFQTRAGRVGLLEVLTARPGLVELRYKLVQER